MFQLSEKAGELPRKDSWLNSWSKRSRFSENIKEIEFIFQTIRSLSDGDQSAVKIYMVSWLGGFKQGKLKYENSNRKHGLWGTERARIRRSSSKVVEEAMSSGLSKVFITIYIYKKKHV